MTIYELSNSVIFLNFKTSSVTAPLPPSSVIMSLCVRKPIRGSPLRNTQLVNMQLKGISGSSLKTSLNKMNLYAIFNKTFTCLDITIVWIHHFLKIKTVTSFIGRCRISHQRNSVKKVFLKTSQYSQENACAGVTYQ